jgi:toxin ParE1/3/4
MKKLRYLDIADRFITLLIKKCEDIASLPFLIGKARPDLHPDLHSVVIKGYIIFFCAADNSSG